MISLKFLFHVSLLSLCISGTFLASHLLWAEEALSLGLDVPQGVADEIPALSGGGNPFRVDERLKKNLDFWIRIYSQYYTYQGIIHDSKFINFVYEVVDMRDRFGQKRAHHAKKHWKEVLLSLNKKERDPAQMLPDQLSNDEKRVLEFFTEVQEPNKFLNASHRKRIRYQLGQKDNFLQGLYESGRYLPQMEEIFKKEGLPIELTRLPFVESSFNVRARSKVGASGIWQFMRSTGRLYLQVDDAVDERNDPIRATEAAAKLLKLNYESLKSWPLAVTAYNHGRKGMMRAVRQVGSDDLEDLVENYRSRSFGFASSNFFTELLAAIEVEKNYQKYFGNVARAAPMMVYEVRIPDYIDFRQLLRLMGYDAKKIRDLNPALSDAVFEGQRRIPQGYVLRLPSDGSLPKEAMERIFFAGYSQIPGVYKHRVQLKTSLASLKNVRRTVKRKSIRSKKRNSQAEFRFQNAVESVAKGNV